jgi:hypothetical protein
MAKEFKLNLAGQELALQLGHKVTKDDLYGSVKKVIEANGKVLERGYLLPTGVLLRRSQIAYASVDGEGTCVEEPTVFVNDEPAVQTPSSFNQAQPLTKIAMTNLVDFCADDVYQVQTGELAAGLYQTVFAYYASYQPREALLLVRGADDAFLLIGERKAAPFVGRTVSYEFFDAQAAEEADLDPLDFSMN